jgi:hypothetical protein
MGQSEYNFQNLPNSDFDASPLKTDPVSYQMAFFERGVHFSLCTQKIGGVMSKTIKHPV